MTHEEISEIALQAKIVVFSEVILELCQLVAEKEREECAKVCEDAPEPDGTDLAERIRARNKL